MALWGLVILIQPWRLSGELLASAPSQARRHGLGCARDVKRLQKKTSISMLMITLWQMVIGTGVLAGACAWFEPQSINWTASFVACITQDTGDRPGRIGYAGQHGLDRRRAGDARLEADEVRTRRLNSAAGLDYWPI